MRANRRVLFGAVAVLGTALLAGTAGAAGFAIMEAGSKGTGMGGAFVATADDPSAAFYNPAGNAWNDKFQVMVGDTLIFPSSKLYGDNPYPGAGYEDSQKHQIFFPPNLYVVAPVAHNFNVTFGSWFPYGLSTNWENPDQFAGRFLSQRIDLRTYAFTIQGSVALADWISIGAGPELRVGDVKLQRNVPFFNPFTNRFVDVAHVDLVGDGMQSKMTWNAGILLKPLPCLRFGASYHGKANIDFTGTTNFYQVPTGNPQLDGAIAQSLPFGVGVPTSAMIQFPALAMFGVAWDPTDRLTLELDGNWTQWDVFDSTTLAFSPTAGKTVPNEVLVHNWKNSWTIRGGANFQATKALNVNAGIVYDQTPQPDEDVSPLLPDANRTGYSVGFGVKVGERTSINASNLFLFFHDRPTNGHQQDNFNGTYKTFADLFVLNIRHSF